MKRTIPLVERPGPVARRPAFTLTELLVAVAIMAGMMTMVAMIFTTASRSSGQAQASAQLYRHLREAAETIRRDLQLVEPGEHILSITGGEITAPAQPNDPNVRPHRADVLMFLNNRGGTPVIAQVPDDDVSPTVQIVYGHADYGQLALNAATGEWVYAGGRTRIEDGALPASRWHLARRVIHFPKSDLSSPYPQGSVLPPLSSTAFCEADADLSRLALDHPDLNRPRGVFHYRGNTPYFVYMLHDDSPWGFTFNWYLFRQSNLYLFYEGHWWRSASGSWRRDEYDPVSDSMISPPSPAGAPAPHSPSSLGTPDWAAWYYTPGPSGGRTVVPAQPPERPGAEKRFAHYFLPGCSEFQVEYSHDEPQEVTLDDQSPLPNPVLAAPVRWQSVPVGDQWTWSGMSPGSLNYGAEDLRQWADPLRWPRAVRITLRVHDPAGRLPEPITETIVHAWR